MMSQIKRDKIMQYNYNSKHNKIKKHKLTKIDFLFGFEWAILIIVDVLVQDFVQRLERRLRKLWHRIKIFIIAEDYSYIIKITNLIQINFLIKLNLKNIHHTIPTTKIISKLSKLNNDKH